MSDDFGVNAILTLLRAYIKDTQFEEFERKMISTQMALLQAEAQSRRNKNASIIKEINQINIKLIGLRNIYNNIKPSLNEEAILKIEEWINSFEKRKKSIAKEKF